MTLKLVRSYIFEGCIFILYTLVENFKTHSTIALLDYLDQFLIVEALYGF